PGPVKHDEGTSSSGRLVPVARPGTSSGHPVRTLPRTAGPRTLLGSLYCETATCSFLRRRTRSPPGRATPPVSDFLRRTDVATATFATGSQQTPAGSIPAFEF